MGKTKRRSIWSTRKCILCSLATVAIVTILYQVAIFCALQQDSNVNLFASAVTKLSAEDMEKPRLDRAHADVVLHELSGFRDESFEELQRAEVLNTVHFVWCENKTFSFTNYLSVLSVWKFLKPDMIEFHQAVAPKKDKYDDWLEEIQKTIPSFVVKDMPPHWDGQDKGCGFWFGLAVIDDRGGIYVNEEVIITEEVARHRQRNMSLIFFEHQSENFAKISVAMGKDHETNFRRFKREFANDQHAPDNAEHCEIIDPSLLITTNASCFHVEAMLSPKVIFQLDSRFGELIRRIMYGFKSIKQARSVLPGTIPKIVHYVWFGSKEMDFMMYLSILSTLYIVNPERVLIHTDGGLKGKYMDKVLKDKRIILVNREKPFNIFGHQVLYAQHRSDIVRAECLLKYGGIYMDWDVLWLKNPDDLLATGYDAIANFDHMQQGSFPDSINLGVLMAKPKSTFIKKWQYALRNYRSDDFLYNAVLLPYKVYEKYPEYLHIERTLQVMCFRLKCHPTFRDDFKNFMDEQEFDWKADVYSIHFTYPDPPELVDEAACRNGTGRFAEMGQMILTHEHKLPK